MKDRYPAYIDWTTYEMIRNVIKDNRAEYMRTKTRGAPRDGDLLLHGIAWCGRCGHKMYVRYKGGGMYVCNRWPSPVRVAAISSSGTPLWARSRTRSRISVPRVSFNDCVDVHLDFDVAYSAAAPDDPDQSDIVLTAIEHDLVDETPQQRFALSLPASLEFRGDQTIVGVDPVELAFGQRGGITFALELPFGARS